MNKVEKPKRPRGRPRVMSPEARRERVFHALEGIYSRDGLDGITMVAIAAEAKMSKRTLYGLFSDRDQLVHEYMQWVRADFVRPLSDREKEYPLRTRLVRLLAPSEDERGGLPLALLRQVIVKPPQPVDCVYGRIQQHLETNRELVQAELDRAVERGEVKIENTREAALLLETMVRPSILEPLVGIESFPSAAELRRRFDFGLAVFLQGIGAVEEAPH
ncbi:TetR/AcrR family transcriptional regulator [Allosediminivita pacifica]|nr:TetR/AcrR family transcriptional regulator [Allosediminivita pacifica]